MPIVLLDRACRWHLKALYKDFKNAFNPAPGNGDVLSSELIQIDQNLNYTLRGKNYSISLYNWYKWDKSLPHDGCQKLKMTMIIDLSFILFNIFQPSHYSCSLLLLARSSIPTSIRGDTGSVSLSQIWILCILCRIAEKIFRYYLHKRLFDKKKTDSVLASENARIKSSKTGKCPHSHSHRSGPCLFSGSLRVSFLRWCLPYTSSPSYRSRQRSDPKRLPKI